MIAMTALALFLASTVLAQETILLRPAEKPDPGAAPETVRQVRTGRSISNVSQPDITVYLPPKDKATGYAVVICPGGGYEFLSIDLEGHDVARWLNSIGVAAIVLKYRLPGGAKMRPALGTIEEAAENARVAIEDAEQAMRIVRSKASSWNLRPHGVGMMGFSAGGHLTAMMGMRAGADTRPDFLVLAYPAIPKGLDVSSSTPRTFLMHADDDPVVPPADHSARFYLALKAAKVPAEMHIYSSGGHGFGIRETGKTAAAWTSALANWLAELGKTTGSGPGIR